METHTELPKPTTCRLCGASGSTVVFHTRKNQAGKRYYNLICSKCKNSFNRDSRRVLRAKQRLEDPIRFYLQARDEQLRTKFGITLDQYKEIFKKQNYGCAICGKDDRSEEYKYDMPLDHDHVTKQNRGILCHACNHMLGKAEDDINRLAMAIDYLRNYGRL